MAPQGTSEVPPRLISELMCSISGKVVAVNDALSDSPETLNEDAFGAGWMFKVELDAPATLEGLLDAAGYEQSL